MTALPGAGDAVAPRRAPDGAGRPLLLVGLPAGTAPGAGEPRALVRIGRAVEHAGLDGVVISDHVTIGPRLDRYPWGPFPFPADAPWPEPLTVLTAIAAATERILLTTGVLVVPLRPAALLAKTVATLDRLAPGRLELGVGTGWQEEEFAAQGLDHARRGAMLTDHVGACRALWTDSPARFASASVTFDELWCEPRPTSTGGPPLLFSGSLTARNRDRIVALGDGWIPIMGATPADIATGTAGLREALALAGRDPAGLRVRAPLTVHRGAGDVEGARAGAAGDARGRPDMGATLAGASDLVAAGATEVTIPLVALPGAHTGDPGAQADALADLAARWRAEAPAPA
ncbi:MAG TPA: TIGR03619 family F420-dependent LLM class oxidoreductase [Acidimicrobiales bacterium]|nr:TIGR03619 family F420-dependent LLM class oxidoreductase [Acidimicrobiales bacterium]